MAQAIKRIYGEKRLSLGLDRLLKTVFIMISISKNRCPVMILAAIEKEMEKVIQENLPIVRRVVSRAEAIQHFRGARRSVKAGAHSRSAG